MTKDVLILTEEMRVKEGFLLPPCICNSTDEWHTFSCVVHQERFISKVPSKFEDAEFEDL
jgi:hypothetical protein